MAKEFDNDFFKHLQDSVVKEEPKKENKEKLDDLIAKREQLLRTLEEMKSNVIVDPNAVEEIEKEIRALDKAIEAGKIEAPSEEKIESEEKTAKEIKEAEEHEKKKAEEEAVVEENDEQVVEENERSEQLREQYKEALEKLYAHKIKSIEEAKQKGALITSRDSFNIELKLEEEVYRLRDEYMAMGFDDPFKARRTELIAKEKNAKEPMELALREKARKYREYEEELARMDKEEQEIREQLLDPELSSEKIAALNDDLEQLSAKRKDIEVKLTSIRKDLEPTIVESQSRTIRRADLEVEYLNVLTKDDRANLSYQQSKITTRDRNVEKAEKLEYHRLKVDIENKEHNIKVLKDRLNDTPATDFEERLNLLAQLDEQVGELEMKQEFKAKVDSGVKLTEEEKRRTIRENYEVNAERKEDFVKDTAYVHEMVKEQAKETGEKVVQAPIKASMEDRSRESDAQAAAVAIIADNPHKAGPDTLLDDAVQFGVAKCVIEGLEDKVRDPNVPEDAKEMVANDEAITKAHEELVKKQEEIEKNAER